MMQLEIDVQCMKDRETAWVVQTEARRLGDKGIMGSFVSGGTSVEIHPHFLVVEAGGDASYLTELGPDAAHQCFKSRSSLSLC